MTPTVQQRLTDFYRTLFVDKNQLLSFVIRMTRRKISNYVRCQISRLVWKRLFFQLFCLCFCYFSILWSFKFIFALVYMIQQFNVILIYETYISRFRSETRNPVFREKNPFTIYFTSRLQYSGFVRQYLKHSLFNQDI